MIYSREPPLEWNPHQLLRRYFCIWLDKGDRRSQAFTDLLSTQRAASLLSFPDFLCMNNSCKRRTGENATSCFTLVELEAIQKQITHGFLTGRGKLQRNTKCFTSFVLVSGFNFQRRFLGFPTGSGLQGPDPFKPESGRHLIVRVLGRASCSDWSILCQRAKLHFSGRRGGLCLQLCWVCRWHCSGPGKKFEDHKQWQVEWFED